MSLIILLPKGNSYYYGYSFMFFFLDKIFFQYNVNHNKCEVL